MNIAKEREYYRALLDKSVELTEKLKPGNVTVEAVCAAIGEILPETRIENLEAKVEGIFEGVKEGAERFGKILAAEDKKLTLKQEMEEIFAHMSPEETKGFMINCLQMVYAGENKKDMDGDALYKISSSSLDEMKEKFSDIMFEKAKIMGYERLLEAAATDHCILEENESGPSFDANKHWYSNERAIIAATARFMQTCENGEDDKNSYFFSVFEGAREEMCLTVKDAMDKNKGGELKKLLENVFFLLMICLVILILVYAYFDIAWILMDIYECIGIAFASALGYLWPVYTYLAIMFAQEMAEEMKRIKSQKEDAQKELGEMFKSIETGGEEVNSSADEKIHMGMDEEVDEEVDEEEKHGKVKA